MKQMHSYRRWLALAAVAISPVIMPRLAAAQYSTSAGAGHALDANNQVGSGGYNGGGARPAVTNDDVIYGNVTNLSRFRGKIDNFGAGGFQGVLAGSKSDAFNAVSSSAPTPYAPSISSNAPQPYFAASRGVAPPQGTILLGSGGAALGTSLTPTNSNTYASPNQLDNVRIGTTNIIGLSGESANGFLTAPGSFGSPNANIQSSLSGSLLTGVSVPNAAQQIAQQQAIAGNQLLPGSSGSGQIGNGGSALGQPGLNGLAGNGTRGTNGLNPSQNGLNNSEDNSAGGGNSSNPRSSNGGGNQLNQAVDTSVPLSLPQNSPAAGGGRINDSVGGQGGQYNQGAQGRNGASKLYGPEYQQYQQQLQDYNNPQGTPTRGKPRVIRKTKPGTGATTQPSGANPELGTPKQGAAGQPGSVNNPFPSGITPPGGVGGQGAPAAPAVPADQPTVKYSNIASSARAKSLHDLLAKGDDALKNDRFKDAITTYETGARIAPNNQMITLGLANADLAGGFYAAAEQNIRRAFSNDANVLLVQQDLTSMISSSRLDFIRKDLKDLADKNPKQSRYWLLLSYLDYNADKTQAASDELQKARELTGIADEAIPLMATYWNLPAPSKSGLNK